MSNPNESFAVALPDSQYWSVVTSSLGCDRISDGLTAFERQLERLYTVFGTQFRPTGVAYRVQRVDEDGPVVHGLGGTDDADAPPRETRCGRLETDEGVSLTALTEHLEDCAPADGYVLPARIEFEGESHLYVDGEYQYVDRTDTEVYKH